MTDTSIYRRLAAQTDGAFLIGVVGPVRTGKSTFIKQFMDALVIPHIENEYARERARDELPQSGSGRTIMTAEPKFVPEEAVSIRLDDSSEISVRLIDSVGYMVDGAAGATEDGTERMVTTPWFDHEVTMTEAAELGTRKVIEEHSTIGIVVTTDGSFGELPREKFIEPESRVIRELQRIGKPFLVVLNSADPEGEGARALAQAISSQHNVRVLCVNCLKLDEGRITRILSTLLEEFPLCSIGIHLPDWFSALPEDSDLSRNLLCGMRDAFTNCHKLGDLAEAKNRIEAMDTVSRVQDVEHELSRGAVSISIQMPRALYYQTISEQTGLQVGNDGDLISILTKMSKMQREYERIRPALESVWETGYGVVLPEPEEMRLEEPQIVRKNGKYGVKLSASAPAIHLLRTDVETEVRPAIGGEAASEEIINFLLQGFDGDVNRIWESNIFGKSLNELAEEGLYAKIDSLPDSARRKLKQTLQRLVNENCNNLICILF